MSYVCDGLDSGSVQAAVDAASDDRRRLHIAVVVPGGGSIKPVLLFDDDEFSQQIDANVRPVYLLLKYAGQAMLRAGQGSFVAISSTAAVFSARYLASYSAGKAAVDQLVRVAANELGQYDIRVNSVQPGTDAATVILRAADDPTVVLLLRRTRVVVDDRPAPDKKTRCVTTSSSSDSRQPL